jgi:GTP cyclohydrolase FolE2
VSGDVCSIIRRILTSRVSLTSADSHAITSYMLRQLIYLKHHLTIFLSRDADTLKVILLAYLFYRITRSLPMMGKHSTSTSVRVALVSFCPCASPLSSCRTLIYGRQRHWEKYSQLCIYAHPLTRIFLYYACLDARSVRDT